jgi:hypothetical protein
MFSYFIGLVTRQAMRRLEEEGLMMEVRPEGCWHDATKVRSKEKG